MIKAITFTLVIFLFACAAHKKAVNAGEIPVCLKAKIDSMTANPNEGAPQSITQYNYKGQTVYYMKSPCCDKYNIVFDSNCNILGYPDGGFTGKGDGKMPDFFNEVKDGKVVWSPVPQKDQ
jgi:hypothetical protein